MDQPSSVHLGDMCWSLVTLGFQFTSGHFLGSSTLHKCLFTVTFYMFFSCLVSLLDEVIPQRTLLWRTPYGKFPQMCCPLQSHYSHVVTEHLELWLVYTEKCCDIKYALDFKDSIHTGMCVRAHTHTQNALLPLPPNMPASFIALCKCLLLIFVNKES